MLVRMQYIFMYSVISIMCATLPRATLSATLPHSSPDSTAHTNSTFRQTVRGIIIGGSGAFIATGLIGTYGYRHAFTHAEGSFYDLENVAIAATTAGFFGAALGALFGYATGVEHEELRQLDPAYIPASATWGPRILFIFSNYPRFHLCYKPPQRSLVMPNRLRAGFIYRPRYGYTRSLTATQEQESIHFYAMELDWDTHILWHLKPLKKLIPYIGLATGYAQTHHFDLRTDEATKISSPYIRILGGIELNIVDLIFFELEAMHELYGTQRLLKHYGYHASWNSSIHLYIGSYFF